MFFFVTRREAIKAFGLIAVEGKMSLASIFGSMVGPWWHIWKTVVWKHNIICKQVWFNIHEKNQTRGSEKW